MLSLSEIAANFRAGQSCNQSDLSRLYHSPEILRYLTYEEAQRLYSLLQNKSVVMGYLDVNFHASVYRESSERY